MAISKKLRFEVFKRDGFLCQYCGKCPPEVTLEIDHIHPISKGGSDDINNLITSCFDCNRGKGAIELVTIPNTLQDNYEILKEKEDQYREYQKLLRSIERRKQKDIARVAEIYNTYFEGWVLKEKFQKTTIKNFIDILGAHEVVEAMELACLKFRGKKKDRHSSYSPEENAIKYFCGICWNKIRKKDE